MFAKRLTVLMAALAVASTAPVRAHFLWIAPDASAKEKRVHVYFSERPEADDPDLLSRLKGVKLDENFADGSKQAVEPTRGSDSLEATPAAAKSAVASYSLNHTYGVMSREGESFLLVYHARMYPVATANHWDLPPSEQRLALELVPATAGGKLTVRPVLWHGEPLASAEVKADPAGKDRIDGTSDAGGSFVVAASTRACTHFARSISSRPAASATGKNTRAFATTARWSLRSTASGPRHRKFANLRPPRKGPDGPK